MISQLELFARTAWEFVVTVTAQSQTHRTNRPAAMLLEPDLNLHRRASPRKAGIVVDDVPNAFGILHHLFAEIFRIVWMNDGLLVVIRPAAIARPACRGRLSGLLSVSIVGEH